MRREAVQEGLIVTYLQSKELNPTLNLMIDLIQVLAFCSFNIRVLACEGSSNFLSAVYQPGEMNVFSNLRSVLIRADPVSQISAPPVVELCRFENERVVLEECVGRLAISN